MNKITELKINKALLEINKYNTTSVYTLLVEGDLYCIEVLSDFRIEGYSYPVSKNRIYHTKSPNHLLNQLTDLCNVLRIKL
jgi:hypothetical protein